MITEPLTTRKRLLVLGGGFAGVAAAIDGGKLDDFDVTLVSDRDFMHLFPISIWTPLHKIALQRTRLPLAKIAATHGFSVTLGTVDRIDTASNSVTLADGTVLDYDYLLIALGPGHAKPNGGAHTTSLCEGPDAALELQTKVDALLARGSGSIAVGFGGNPKDGSAVRGGPAFELLFNLDTELRRRKVRDRFTLHFFAPMPNPGNRMGKRAAEMMPGQLDRLGIVAKTGVKIAGFDEAGVAFDDGTRLDADVVMFIPGAIGNPIAAASGLPLNEAGFVRIDDACLVEGTDNVYAAGDVAAIQGPAWRAKQGHIAEMMARHAVFNINNAAHGWADRKGYLHHINIICLMDMGRDAMLVARTTTREIVIPLPLVGNLMKRMWGWYATVTKVTRIPRLPGM